MNPRIAKEIRTHSPVLGLVVVCVAAILSVAVIQGPYNFIETRTLLFGGFFVCCLITAATAFGNEFHHRTMSQLLSQPVDRRGLWWEKMRVLAAFNATCALVTFIALILANPAWRNHQDAILVCGLLILLSVLFSCTTPFFTLISRSTIGGSVFAVFCAGMLLLPANMIWNRLAIAGWMSVKDKLTGGLLDGPDFIYAILAVPYCAALYWLGRRKFMRMEVIDSQALEANLPAALDRPLANLSAKFTRPFARLVIKELCLQRINFLLTAAVCVFMGAEYFLWKPESNRTFFVAGTLLIYVFLFPVMVCAAAVAEEKTWGMKDWHLTLPPSYGKQWRAKWLVALALSVLLGAGLAYLFARFGPWQKEMKFEFEPEQACLSVLVGVALYAASISGSTIRAFLLTFGLMLLIGFSVGIGLNALGAFYPGPGEGVNIVFVLCMPLVSLYYQIIWLLWNLIVSPVWWLTHSMEKTNAVIQWAEPTSNNHLQIILLLILVCCFFGLLLRFAKANYRDGDLVIRRVVKQLLIILLAAFFLGVALAASRSRINSYDLPRWTFLRPPPAN